jgi:hypothetical protein
MIKYIKVHKEGVASIHRDAEKGCSRKLGFRCTEFSETELPEMEILGNPGNPGPIAQAFSRGAHPNSLPTGPEGS